MMLAPLAEKYGADVVNRHDLAEPHRLPRAFRAFRTMRHCVLVEYLTHNNVDSARTFRPLRSAAVHTDANARGERGRAGSHRDTTPERLRWEAETLFAQCGIATRVPNDDADHEYIDRIMST
jgi:hypothetical protein